MKRLFELLRHYWQFALTLVVGITALVLAFGMGLDHWAQALVTVFGVFIALILLVEMIKVLRSGSYGVDILAITAIIATLAIGQYWASLVIIVMLTGGEALEDYATHRARRELGALLARTPRVAHILVDGTIKDVAVDKVKPGDTVSVRPYEMVPVDGVLLSKEAEFDESSLTGEAVPIGKKAGAKVMSGSINGASTVEIKASADAAHSQYEQIIALVREAESSPAPFVRMADRYAVPFTLVSFAIAGFAWTTSGEAQRFAEVLVLASPCPLILAAPIALISGMSRASKRGVIVKGGAVLEQMAAVKAMAFDKTGTLTRGNVVVSRVEAEKGFKTDEIVTLAASSELGSSHILATSLVKYAEGEKLKVVAPDSVKESLGDGVEAKIGKKSVLVGKLDFLAAHGVPGTLEAAQAKASGTSVAVAVGGKFAGTIYFTDQVRPEAKKTLRLLKKLGIQKTVMLTGDKQATAEEIGKVAGVDEIHAELLPTGKVEIVKSLHDKFGSVAMVGDGINDAPTLATADVGIAMGAHGSTEAGESADAIIMVENIGRVAELRQISQRTMSVALQSVWVGIGICVVLMLIATTGVIPAIVGAGLQELVDVSVIFNALRAHNGGRGVR